MPFADHPIARPAQCGRRPVVDQHLAAMPEGEAAAARQILHSDCTNEYAARVFTAEGYKVSASAIRLWRIKHGGGIYPPPEESS